MSEQEKKLHRVCFTGHRPDKLVGCEDKAREALSKAIDNVISNGFCTFITGMCPGIDVIAGEIVVEKRKLNPDIHLIAAMPYPRFAFNWDGWGDRVQKLMRSADYVCNVSTTYTGRGVFQKRNVWMVDHSSLLVAYWNGTPGGTKNTVDYAQKANLHMVNAYVN